MGGGLPRHLSIIVTGEAGRHGCICVIKGRWLEGNCCVAIITGVACVEVARRLWSCRCWTSNHVAICTVSDKIGVVRLAVGRPTGCIVAR